MKTLLKQTDKEQIWIEGFDNYVIEDIVSFNNKLDKLDNKVIYSGKTSEIFEELAKECVQTPLMGDFIDYSNHIRGAMCYIAVSTAKESIQSACSQPYCIIYKTNLCSGKN